MALRELYAERAALSGRILGRQVHGRRRREELARVCALTRQILVLELAADESPPDHHDDHADDRPDRPPPPPLYGREPYWIER